MIAPDPEARGHMQHDVQVTVTVNQVKTSHPFCY